MGPEQALRHTLFRDSNMNADDIMERKRRKSRKPRENLVAEKSSVGLALLHKVIWVSSLSYPGAVMRLGTATPVFWRFSLLKIMQHGNWYDLFHVSR